MVKNAGTLMLPDVRAYDTKLQSSRLGGTDEEVHIQTRTGQKGAQKRTHTNTANLPLTQM